MKMLRELVALLILGQICVDLPEVGGAIVKRTDGVLGMEKLHYDRPGQCPTGATWCRHTNGESSCCPLTNAVCCANAPNCCPEGTTCSASGKCETLSVIPWSEKTEADIVEKWSLVNSVVCPGGQAQCPDGTTCCKLSTGQWGCCAFPNAVCCSDGLHCCPQGYTCDVAGGTCSKMIENDVVSLEITSLAKTSSPINSVICPGGQAQCPDGTTCCKLSTGQWGCCPFPNAVCCSDGLHCCPQGYTCNVAGGTCSKMIENDVVSLEITSLAKTSSPINSVICPGGQAQCPDGTTCCKLSTGQWGCCAFPNAVCCSDGLHCCPQGYTCNVAGGTCSKMIENDVVSLEMTSLAKTSSPINSVICPGGQAQCPDGTTCCKLSTGQWGCCAFPNAVCCSDGLHCCPQGYTCNVAGGTCSKMIENDVVSLEITSLAKTSSPINSVICPGGQAQCPDGTTCCKLSTGQWGCCAFPNAVCCSDGLHCCPQGYTCDVAGGTCSKMIENDVVSLEMTSLAKTSSPINSVICPGGQAQCPDGTTCCKLSTGQWGCCAFPNAVCCSDGLHCCPQGYTCDVAGGTCSKMIENDVVSLEMTSLAKTSSPINSVICPGGQAQCPDGTTCCKLSTGQWGCCAFPNAVCCSDGLHCCPQGYTCDVAGGTCSKMIENDVVSLEMTSLAKTSSPINSVICPGGQAQCPDGTTCCKLSTGQWGCCAFPNAVCCSDGLHCCPQGYTCDVAGGTCSKMIENDVVSLEMTSLAKTSSPINSVICPGGQAQCPDGTTCCKLSTGQWGCCAFPNAVCCSDGLHCCPQGYTCDVAGGTCSKMIENDVVSLEMTSLAKTSSPINSVICPGGQAQCPDGTTCCKLSTGQWGCCAFPNAVCCSDGLHCCPQGYTCDVAGGTCSKMIENDVVSLEMTSLAKTSSPINSVICPGGQAQCPDGTTCCKLSTGQWGCCAFPNAVCCSDGLHCCPQGYTCNVAGGTCSKVIENEVMSSEMTSLAKYLSPINSVICPGGQSQCLDGNTCCKLSSGQWGCCPYTNAVCCSDQLHCCPNGYTCSSGSCIRSSPAKALLSAIMPRKIVNEEQGTSREL